MPGHSATLTRSYYSFSPYATRRDSASQRVTLTVGQKIEQRGALRMCALDTLINAVRFTFCFPFPILNPANFQDIRPVDTSFLISHTPNSYRAAQLPRLCSKSSVPTQPLLSTHRQPRVPYMTTMSSSIWTCCQCGGVNLVETAPACPLCGHMPCGYCVVTAYESPGTANNSVAERPTDSNSSKRLDLSGSVDPNGCSTLTSPALDPLYNPMPSCHSKKRGSKGEVPLNSLPYEDIWTCCQCGSTNVYATSVRCPLCAHDPCGYCKWGC